MADEVDLAHDREEAFRSEAIRRARGDNLSVNVTGTCGNCGEPIDPRRLKVLPTAVFCIDCANA